MTGKQLSLYARERMLALLSSGASIKEVLKELEKEGINPCRQTVWRFWCHYRKYGFLAPRPRSGRHTKLTNDVLDVIERTMQHDDEATLKEIAVILASRGYKMSLRTVLKGRRSLGWTTRGAAYCQLIRELNKAKRVVWAREHINDDFPDVVWSDETTVQLETHRRFCCRKKGQKPRYKPRPKHPIKLHVWAGISCEGATKLCIFEGIMNAELYVEILDQCLVPFLQQKYPSGHRFMQDNDPKHTSRLAQAFFERKGINWWRTPPESPDANPIENLWHELKVRSMYFFSLVHSCLKWVLTLFQEFIRREVKPTTKEQLIEGIQQFWATVTVEKCRKYIGHLKKVLPKIIVENGDVTGY